MNLHASAVALDGEGVLLLGASGAGKTDLALRLIHAGGRLVADDRVILTRTHDTLHASAPSTLMGVLELRGIGLIRLDALASAPLRLAVTCSATAPERLPPPRSFEAHGLHIPHITLDPFHASAPARLALYLSALGRGDTLPCDWFATPASGQHLAS
jgi:HPr kinase/phosphorylase